MDVTTLALAKKYTDSQRIGYVGKELMPVDAFVSGVNEEYKTKSAAGWYIRNRVIETSFFTIGAMYHVVFDGISYECICKSANCDNALNGYPYIGNAAGAGNVRYSIDGEDTGEPFAITVINTGMCISAKESGVHSYAISEMQMTDVVHKISHEFIPIATADTVGGAKAIAAAKGMTEQIGITEDGYLVTDAVAKANEYTNSQRLGYSEMRNECIYSLKLKSDDSGEWGNIGRISGVYNTLIPGKKYLVKLDDGEYITECKHAIDGAYEFTWLGNSTIVTSGFEEDTGECFLFRIMYYTQYGFAEAYAYDMNYGHSMEICEEEQVEYVARIDPKFLPDGGVGYSYKGGKGDELVPQADYTVTGSGEEFLVQGISLVIGESYYVIYDGVDYVLKCVPFEGVFPALITDTFVIAYNHYADTIIYMDAADMDNGVETSTHNVGVWILGEVVRQIDPKFLPTGGVGYTKADYTLLLSVEDLDFGDGSQPYLADKLGLVEGEVYKMVLDGTAYECVAYANSDGLISFGATESDTSIPFVVADGAADGVYCAILLSTGGVHSFSIYKKTEVICHINPKYIPGAVFPVVEFPYQGTGDIALDADLTAVVEGLIADDVWAFMLKFHPTETVTTAVVMHRYDSNDAFHMYYGNNGSVSAGIGYEDGAYIWHCDELTL